MPPDSPSGLLSLLDRRWVPETLIALAVVILFAPTLAFGWVYDDQMEIVLNPLVQSLQHLPQLFSTTAWAGSGMETYLYRPLAFVTYAFNHRISGLDPWSYHLVNLLLHALASVLVFRVGRSWGLSTLAAGFGGLLFALHPVHVEVVAAVFGRKDLLAAVFLLAMVLLHGEAKAGKGWRAVLPVGAFACALLSKEVGMVGIALVAAQDWLTTSDRKAPFRSKRLANLYVAYGAALLGYVLVRNTVTGGVTIPETFYMDNPMVLAGAAAQLATALVVMGKGVALQFLPLALSPDYSFNAIPLVEDVFDWRFLGTVAGAALALGILRTSGARKSWILLALSWYLLAVLPTSNLLLTVGTIFGERLLYLPSVAFCLLAGGGMAWTVTRYGSPALMMGAAVLIGFSVQTARYSAAWDNDVALFTWAVAAVPESTKAQHKLGEELLRAGEPEAALLPLNRAMEIAPDNEFAARTLDVARRHVADRYLPNPSITTPTRPIPQDPHLLYVLGQISRNRGDLAGAERFWEEAIALDPTHGESLGDLGTLELARGDTAIALGHLREAVSYKPGLASAWFNLAKYHVDRGDREEAIRSLKGFLASAGSRYPELVEWAASTLAGLRG